MQLRKIPGGITAPRGFLAGVDKAEIKKKDKYDIALIVSERPASAAAVFTTNKFQAAPVLVSRQHIAGGTARGIVVNSGCANACTGQQGLADAEMMAGKVSELVGCSAGEIMVASTGVIGVPLPMEKVVAGIERAAANLDRKNGSLAAQAIMTTDTFPKEIAVELDLEGVTTTIGAMAKGAGMIHPNMATLLAFITTDAAISSQCLQEALNSANEDSFNMVTVDGDTSTNDSLFVMANGSAGNALIDDTGSKAYKDFAAALKLVCVELARLIARDGEGATKLIEVKVVNALDLKTARLAARAIAGSSLVKAAIFGEDANWGRIICALGYSGAEFDPGRVDVFLGDLPVARDGGGLAFDEEQAAKILKEKEITILVDLKQGQEEATAWGCDLTYEYVKINGAYRT